MKDTTDYTRWGSGLASIVILPHTNNERWIVNIDGDGAHYTDTFLSVEGAIRWAVDVLVAYFDWSMSLAQYEVELSVKNRQWRTRDPRSASNGNEVVFIIEEDYRAGLIGREERNRRIAEVTTPAGEPF